MLFFYRYSKEAPDVLAPVQKHSRENRARENPPRRSEYNDKTDNLVDKSKEWIRQLDKSGEQQRRLSGDEIRKTGYRSNVLDKEKKPAENYE